jgi:hypothetical protein
MQKHFDSNLSYTLDAVVVLLDKRPPWWVRGILRWYKRSLERGITR